MVPLLIVAAFLTFSLVLTVAFSRPEATLIGVIVVAILIPVQVAIQPGSLPRIGPTRLLIAAFLVGWSLHKIIVRHRVMSRPERPLRGYICFYVGALVLSTILSINTSKSVFDTCNQLVFFVLFYILIANLRHPRFWPRLKHALFAVTGLLCALSFYEEVARVNPFLSLYPGEVLSFRGQILRVRADFFHPIAFGSYLVLVLPFILVDLIQSKARTRTSALFLLLVAALAALFLTGSRGPWFAGCVELFIFAVYWARVSWRRTAATLAAAGMMISISLVTFSAVGALQRLIDPYLDPNNLTANFLQQDQASSEYYRVALAGAVLDRLSGMRWVYGFGPGTFYVADVKSKYAGTEHVLTAADSHPFLLLLESGLLGAAAFVLLIWASVSTCVHAVTNFRGPKQTLAVGCLASVVGFICTNLTASMFNSLPLAILFWTSVAVACSIQAPSRRLTASVPLSQPSS